MRILLSALLAGAALSAAGCYSTETGSKRFGVPFAQDKVESRYQRSAAQVFKAAKDVLAYNGTITAKVDNKSVWFRVDEIETGVARTFVQVRTRAGGTDILLAAELDKQIAVKLTQTR
jgi:hypothetical protein